MVHCRRRRTGAVIYRCCAEAAGLGWEGPSLPKPDSPLFVEGR